MRRPRPASLPDERICGRVNQLAGYYVTGGAQRADVKDYLEWFAYGEASIFHVDAGGGVRRCVSYETPDEIRPDDPEANIVFKAGSLDGDRLHVCTQTEILSYALPGFEQVGYATHPWLNDVHHVCRNDAGNFLAANTGLDMVMELTPAGELVRYWSALADEDPWDRFDKDIDYRKVVTTKPHHAHPNYVFMSDGGLWVSRFVQKDAVCLDDMARVIPIGIEKVHDGNIFGGRVWFTAVDGHVVVANAATGAVETVHDLNAMTDTTKTLGWCRGLHVLDEERVVVGFSRIRPSRFKENVQWIKFQIGKRESAGKLPTRIACYHLGEGRVEWEVDLEKHGLNAVFSILPAG